MTLYCGECGSLNLYPTHCKDCGSEDIMGTDNDNCIVGRGLLNDELPGWTEPCQEPVTEEFIVPVGKWFPESAESDIWPFCQEHGKQFRKALNDATEGACN